MRKTYISIILVSLFFFSCNEKAEIPSDVLSKDKMTLVLTDIGQVEAQIQSSGLERNDSTKKVAYGYYKSIFQKHKITPEQFRKSFDFYTAHLEMMDAMYDTVIVNLSKRAAEEASK
jgi:Domain of unknown function (DUF4296)